MWIKAHLQCAGPPRCRIIALVGVSMSSRFGSRVLLPLDRPCYPLVASGGGNDVDD